ncbi:MAG: SDR family NAD(P)-dependent oxidoreductase [Melioribacteraceae bacterium]|nr:SDR family NAD(P)-dependent oxidoreductase [Melioribacteraceae bacterium]
MELLKGKIAFITGASAGIGKSTAVKFAEEGADLIISARRIEKINELADELQNKFKIKVHAVKLDVRNKEEVKSVVASLPEEWKEIDILVNNAGLSRGVNKLHEEDYEGIDEMIDTNVKGALNIIREVVPLMVKREKGHIINLGSTAGHEAYSGGGVYCATKHAINAITKSLRLDLLGKNIKVSSVDPGMVETDFSKVRFYGDEERAKKVYQGITPLYADDIAETILYMATRSANVNLAQVIMMPVNQGNAYFFHRE